MRLTDGQKISLGLGLISLPLAMLLAQVTELVAGDPTSWKGKLIFTAGGWFALAMREYAAWVKRERRKLMCSKTSRA
jgi:hypothetical protein